MSAYATFFFEKEQHSSIPVPLHSKLSSSTSFQNMKDGTINSSIQSNTSRDTTKQHLDEKVNNGWYHNPANDLFISILSASINPIHLIQSFTRRSSTASTKIRQRISHISNTITNFNKPNLSSTITTSNNSHENATTKTLSTHARDDNDDIWGEYSDNIHDDIAHTVHLDTIPTEIDKSICSGSVLDTKPHHGPYGSSYDTTTHDNTASTNPQEDAIEFNLSITFNGRKYRATRALQSFVKLRKDLLLEYSKTRSNKKRYSGGQYHVGPRSNFGNEHLLDTKPGLTEIQKEEEEEEEELVIPELPIGSSSNKGQGLEHGAMNMMGMVGNGFRGLQEAVFAYASPMERWIRTVAALAPTSQALANFLWEPIDQMDEKVNSMNLQRVQTLNSIHEGCDDGHESGSTSSEEDQW